jgi:hypothetical protein
MKDGCDVGPYNPKNVMPPGGGILSGWIAWPFEIVGLGCKVRNLQAREILGLSSRTFFFFSHSETHFTMLLICWYCSELNFPPIFSMEKSTINSGRLVSCLSVFKSTWSLEKNSPRRSYLDVTRNRAIVLSLVNNDLAHKRLICTIV